MTELPLVGRHRRAARGAVDRDCRPRRSRPTCMQAMYGRNSESARCAIVAAASESGGLRSTMAFEACRIAFGAHAARRSCSPMATSPTARSRGCCRRSRICRTIGSTSTPMARTSCPTRATTPRWRVRGRFRARRVSSTVSADSRRRTSRGNVSYDAENHEKMTHLRAEKVARIANSAFPTSRSMEIPREASSWSWGGGALSGRLREPSMRPAESGLTVSRAHLRHLNPFPRNLGEVLGRFDKVLVPEMNMGQLAWLTSWARVSTSSTSFPPPRSRASRSSESDILSPDRRVVGSRECQLKRRP